MRIGNGAYDQRQNDVYGALLDSIYIHSRPATGVPERWLADRHRAGRGGARRSGDQPDQGIWEARGEPKHYVSSKLMCWVALDRGARLAGDRAADRSGGALAQDRGRRSSAEILERGVSDRGVLPPALRDRRARRLDCC